MLNTYGLILAGGRSSRMKTDKATLEIEGKTLLQLNTEKLQELGLRGVFISGSQHGGIADQWSNKGPLGGIFSVLSQKQLAIGSSMLVLPVDMPLISTESLRRLLAFSQQNQQSCFFQSTWLPACIYVNATVMRQLHEFPAEYGRCSVRHFLLKISATSLQLQDTKQLANCNTPEDWYVLQSQ